MLTIGRRRKDQPRLEFLMGVIFARLSGFLGSVIGMAIGMYLYVAHDANPWLPMVLTYGVGIASVIGAWVIMRHKSRGQSWRF